MHPFLLPALRLICKTKADCSALNTKTIIFGLVAAVAAVGIAAIISNLIAFEGGANPRDPQKRRAWFWSVLSTALVAFFSYHQFMVLPKVAPAWTGNFLKFGMIPGTVILLVTYLVLGFLFSRFLFRSTKLSSWFPASRR